MRLSILCVLCLVLNSAVAQASSSSLPSNSVFNCDELSAHVQTLRESSRPRKEKFSCILNLLKSALSDELENFHTEITDVKNKSVSGDRINDDKNTVTEKAIEQDITNEAKMFVLDDKVKQEKTNDCTNNINSEFPTMIPIFKPKPVMRSNFADKFQSTHLRPMSNSPEAVHAKSNQIINSPKFTIPCQRAADVLDMSNVALPKKITENNVPIAPVTRSISANHIPTTVLGNCEDLDESVVMKFKPKAISLIQLYGNLLKKITITVLVPYHMSKMGQQ